MTADDRLTEVFDRGLRDGVETLGPEDRELFRIQDFILEYEMNGLSGYFYNRLPDLAAITATVAAMRKYGLPLLASLLNQAAELFVGYADPDPPTTWSKVLQQFDPTDRLFDLNEQIRAISGYGVNESFIAEPDAPADGGA